MASPSRHRMARSLTASMPMGRYCCLAKPPDQLRKVLQSRDRSPVLSFAARDLMSFGVLGILGEARRLDDLPMTLPTPLSRTAKRGGSLQGVAAF
jgi:hypothetical protein